jgi:transcriptional regulator with XRE-family HTH domain
VLVGHRRADEGSFGVAVVRPVNEGADRARLIRRVVHGVHDAQVSEGQASIGILSAMPATERRRDRANRLADRALGEAARELRLARLSAGLSQEQVAASVGVSHSTVSRLERGGVGEASIRQLARVGVVLGLDLSVRFYPGGDAIRDAGHLALLGRLRSRLSPAIRWRTEVPLPITGDARAWDAVIAKDGWSIGVEAETRLRDTQAVMRRTELKVRDGGLDGLILLLADTRSNRSAVRVGAAEFGRFTVSQRDALRELGQGRAPGGDALIIL